MNKRIKPRNPIIQALAKDPYIGGSFKDRRRELQEKELDKELEDVVE